jgi:hypothetical protein
MKTAKRVIVGLLAIFVFSFLMCEGGDAPDIQDLDDDVSTDDNTTDDDDNNDNNDNDDADDDDSQFEDDDNSGDDEDSDSSVMEGCDGVDFLFVIDNSISMGDHQKSLIASFPGFMSAITDTLEVDDFHVMVVDSDAKYGGLKSAKADCNDTLGAGHIGQNLGVNCNITGGNRYLVKEQSDLNGTFECAANVGVDGDGYEKAMEAMVNSVNKENQAGGCNADFLREKAVLVVVFITDEDEQCTETGETCSSGDPSTWKSDLVKAMGGKERNIVVLAIFGDNDLTDGICLPYDDDGNGAQPAPLLRTFVKSFAEDRIKYCSVCLEDYSQCFLDAVSVIDTTCQEIE